MSREAMKARSGPLTWPWPADTPLDRSRRVAQSYRAALELVDADAARAIDAWAADHGQGWVVGATWDYDENELLTLREAADRANVQPRTIYQWHRRGLPYVGTVDGLRVKAGDLVRWVRERRQARVGNTTR
jgi:hypothetical protein